VIHCKPWWKNAINLKQLTTEEKKERSEEESFIQQLVFLSVEEKF